MLVQSPQCSKSADLAYFREIHAVFQLKVLDDEFHVDHAAPPGLDIVTPRRFPSDLLLHAHPQPVNLPSSLFIRPFPVNGIPYDLFDARPELCPAGYYPRLGQGLALPYLRFVPVVDGERHKGGYQRPGIAGGTKSSVYLVDVTFPGRD